MKSTLFYDDLFTFIAASPTNLTPEGRIAKYNWTTYNFEQNKFYTAEQVKKSLFSIDPSFKSIIKDLKTIHSSNLERQHPPLYFYIMRIWGIGLDGLDVQSLIHRGCFLNLIFFSLSFFFMFKLLSIIRNDKKFIAAGLIFGFISTGSLVNLMPIRPYAMQECFIILVSYIFVLLYKKIRKNEIITYKQILLYALGFSLLLLSGYFSLIFFGLVCFILICICIFNKRFSHLKYILAILFFTVLITLCLYPGYFDLWTDNAHINTVSKKAFTFDLSSLISSFKLSYALIFNYILLSPVVLILILLILMLKKYNIGTKIFIENNQCIDKENLLPILYIILICLIWSIISIYISPYRTFRYIAAASIIFSLVLTLCTYKFKTVLKVILIILFIIFSIRAPFYINKRLPELSVGIQLPFITNDNEKALNFFCYNMNNNNFPVVFTDPYWFNVNYIVLMNNDKLISFSDIDYINNSNIKNCYIITIFTRIEKINLKITSLYYLFEQFICGVTKQN